jgi:nitrite reductase/ring-hydroxylating ferredoxin subunit
MTNRYVVATLDEIPPGERKVVEVGGRSIGVFNINGEFYALRNRCPHQGGPVCQGRLTGFLECNAPGEFNYKRKGEILRCPWHGWEFDVKTGQSWVDPTRMRTRSYKVSVESGEAALEKGPYVAETYLVSVEEEYVVVELP